MYPDDDRSEIHLALQRAANDALNVHNASNLSGVLFSWAQHQAVLREVVGTNHGTEYFRHCVNLLFLSKVTSLLGVQCDGIGGISEGHGDLYASAEHACRALLDSGLNNAE